MMQLGIARNDSIRKTNHRVRTNYFSMTVVTELLVLMVSICCVIKASVKSNLHCFVVKHFKCHIHISFTPNNLLSCVVWPPQSY